MPDTEEQMDAAVSAVMEDAEARLNDSTNWEREESLGMWEDLAQRAMDWAGTIRDEMEGTDRIV